jgi:AcrR family transcriptional regulator
MAEQRGDRRAQIAAAACRVIARDGAAAVTTRKIAGEAGVNLATLHSLFGSKDTLLLAVLDQVTGRMIEALAPPAQARHGLRAALAETAAALWALADGEPRLVLVRCELLLYMQRRPAHRQEARAQQRRYREALAAVYRRAHAKTNGRVAYYQTLAELVASTVDGLALRGACLGPTNTHKQVRAQALRAVLALVEEDVPPMGTTKDSGKRTHPRIVQRQRPATGGNPLGVDISRLGATP